MMTTCDACKKTTPGGQQCICHFCLLNDRCKKATEHCRARDDCPIDCFTTPANAWVPMGRRTTMSYWTVFPEDPDIMPQDFESYREAKEYADGLCCSYTIERAS